MVVSKMSCTNIKWRTGSITIVHIYYIVAIVDPSFTTREGDATKIVSRLFFAGDHAQLTIMLTITQATMLKKRKHKMKRCNTEPQVYKYKYILELLHISLFVCACVCLSVCSTQSHTNIKIQQSTHISMCGPKVPHTYTG